MNKINIKTEIYFSASFLEPDPHWKGVRVSDLSRVSSILSASRTTLISYCVLFKNTNLGETVITFVVRLLLGSIIISLTINDNNLKVLTAFFI